MSASNYDTSIPAPRLTEAGLVAPSEQEILAGVQADINAALGGNANAALNTPQGQLATSLTAILGDTYAALLNLFNGMDPASNSGRMQEAIGRIYFLERRPATSTTVTAQITTTGGGQTIQAGTILGVDKKEYLYAPTSDVTLPPSPGQTTIALTCATPGPITCAVGALTLYQSGFGITDLSNDEVGLTGNAAESRAEFEKRRKATVAKNSIGHNAALLGGLLSLSDVTDAYVTDNPNTYDTTLNGVTVTAGSLYIVVQGGSDNDIARTILAHKPPGCPMQGNVTVEVKDTNEAYQGLQPSYSVKFDRVETVPVFVKAKLAHSGGDVPQDAPDQARNAIMTYLQKADTRPHLGSTLYASRLAAAVNALGMWSDVLELTVSADEHSGSASLKLPMNQLIVPDASKISISIETV